MKQATNPGGRAPVPIIDITPFTTGEIRRRTDAAEAVRTACEEIGFFVMTGHGFPESLVTRIHDVSRAFFDLPAEEKNRIGESGPVMGGLMHFGLGKETLAATLGGEPIPDLKETLDFGPGFFGDRWPVRPPGLEPAWRAYYEAMSTLAATLRSIFATALGLAPEYFEDRFRGHLSSLRVIDYPDQSAPPAPGQLRAGAHSDYGVLTILRTEDAPGGLQVRTRAGRWSDVPHIPGSFVVNIGDAMLLRLLPSVVAREYAVDSYNLVAGYNHLVRSACPQATRSPASPRAGIAGRDRARLHDRRRCTARNSSATGNHTRYSR